MTRSRKSHPDQLDLFCWTPPRLSAELVAFPAARMRGAMRDAAAELLALPAERQAKKLALEVGLLRLRLQRQRFPTAEIERQTAAFRLGIECEIRRQLIEGILRERHGDAA